MRTFFALLALLTFASTNHAAAASPFDQWEKEIQAFENEDRAHAPPKNAILFVGSSSIRLWTNLHAAFPKHTLIQRGFGGSKMADALHFVDRLVLKYEPKHVLVYEGDNDIAGGVKPEVVVAQFKEFVEKVHALLPQTKISYISIKPSPSRWKLKNEVGAANSAIKEFAGQHPRLEYIDVWTPMLGADGAPRPELFVKDNLHMNGIGYDIWRKVIGKHLD